ncbi:MAG: TatD family hydrolase [Tannerella sp.]|jgi:TatD DNase family protein|nr:TatD family hydrolase [Tannerella sp.]
MVSYDIHTHHNPEHQDIIAIVSIDATTDILPSTGYCSVGIHPDRVGEIDLNSLITIANHSNVVAIGETGLDKLASPLLHRQEELFIRHIELAEKLRKPLIIHCVRAWQELIAIRKRFTGDIPWIIHGFRGKGELAMQLLRFGCYLSFGWHHNSEAVRAAWEAHRLYVETDVLNISIEDVYQRITSQLSISREALSQEILENIQAWPQPINNKSLI